jgi:hypothetical protein
MLPSISPKQSPLARIMEPQYLYRQTITNTVNFRDIKNPFERIDMTLQTLKTQRQKEWRAKTELRRELGLKQAAV